MDWDNIKNALAILSPFLLLALTGFGAMYKFEKEKRIGLEKKLDENKAEIYSRFIQDYTSIFFRPGGKEMDEKGFMDIAENVQKFSRKAIIYGSDEVVEKFSRLYILQNTKLDPEGGYEEMYKRIDAFTDVVIAIRKELGHKKTKLSYDIVGSLLVTDYSKTRR